MEAQERAVEEEREALCRKIVEEERQKLLKRHAEGLLGYLPKVCLCMKIESASRANKCVTAVFILRGCFVKMTYNILMKTLGEILKRKKQIPSLKMAGRMIRLFYDMSLAATRWQCTVMVN